MRGFQGVAFDLDGTLLDTEGHVSTFTGETLEKLARQGIHLIVASGRSFTTLPESVRSFAGIEYAVTGNGAEVYRLTDGHCILRRVMDGSLVMRLLDFAQAHGVALEFYSEGVAYTDAALLENPEAFGLRGYGITYVRNTRRPFLDPRSFVLEREVEGLSMSTPDPALKNKLWQELTVHFPEVSVTSSIPRLLEIADRTVSKGNALEALLPWMDLSPLNLVAYGDAHNDISMLKYAELGIAMGNAGEEVKKIADHVTLSNEEDGLAISLREIFPEKWFL